MNEAVSSLASHEGWKAVLWLLQREVDYVDSKMDDDEPLQHTMYALLHGRRGGLLGAKEALETIVERTESVIDRQRQIHEAGAESPAGV